MLRKYKVKRYHNEIFIMISFLLFIKKLFEQ